jgi:spore coat protein U-like protein
MKTFRHNAITKTARILAAASFAFVAAAAGAATDTGNLTVSATVANQCSVGDAALSLGAITLVNADGTMATLSGGTTAAIPWACTNGTAATLGFDLGGNSSGTDRRMKSTTAGASNQYLEYALKVDSSSGTAIDTTAVALSGADGTNKTFTVWGGPVASAANQAATPATDYTDSVLLTITFTP